jgi:hypothetical protein
MRKSRRLTPLWASTAWYRDKQKKVLSPRTIFGPCIKCPNVTLNFYLTSFDNTKVNSHSSECSVVFYSTFHDKFYEHMPIVPQFRGREQTQGMTYYNKNKNSVTQFTHAFFHIGLLTKNATKDSCEPVRRLFGNHVDWRYQRPAFLYSECLRNACKTKQRQHNDFCSLLIGLLAAVVFFVWYTRWSSSPQHLTECDVNNDVYGTAGAFWTAFLTGPATCLPFVYMYSADILNEMQNPILGNHRLRKDDCSRLPQKQTVSPFLRVSSSYQLMIQSHVDELVTQLRCES